MAKFGDIALKSISLFIRILQFLCSAVILIVFAYFLARPPNYDLGMDNHIRATIGISGAALIYTVIGFLFVCCLGGVAVLGFISILLDLAFAGAFGYIAWVNRDGATRCNEREDVDGGNRNETDDGRFTNATFSYNACGLQTACFAIAIVGAVLFLLSIPLSLFLIKHHKKEKAFGPGPKNGYTAGSGRRRFWQRKPKRAAADPEYGMTGGKAAHNDALPTHTTPTDMRTSYATDTTAVGENHAAYGNAAGYNKYGTGAGGGAPAGTAVPHGYDRRSAAGGNF